ncbi:MAG: DUF5691 domain-containing protein, partial [Planctomycetota bacterium]
MNDRTRAAIVGLAKAGPPTDLPEPLAFAARESDSSETRFLLAAAAENLWREAGRRPEPAPPAPEPCDDEPQELPDAVQRLAATVCGGLDPIRGPASRESLGLLRELCDRLAARGGALPPRTLPAALNAATAARPAPSVRTAVAAAAGARGRWLARFNPDRAWLAEEAPDDASGEKASFAERFSADRFSTRLAAFNQWRQADPAAARGALEEVWKGETAPRRAALSAALEIGLSAADEPFLEAALADRSKAVPAVAERLLLHRPDSAFAQARRRAADALLTVTAGRKPVLEVTLPPRAGAQIDGDGGFDWEAVATDGRPSDGRGVRAERLVRVVSSVPPSHWAKRFDRPPAELIALAVAAEKSGHGGDVSAGWVDACGRFVAADPTVANDWAPALSEWLRQRLDRKARKRGWPAGLPDPEPHFTALISALPPERAAAFVQPLLETPVVAGSPAELGAALWDAVPTPWPEEFAHAVVRAVERGRNKRGWEGGYEYHTWHAALPGVLERLPPAVLAALPPDWPTVGDPPQWLEKAVEALRLRR